MYPHIYPSARTLNLLVGEAYNSEEAKEGSVRWRLNPRRKQSAIEANEEQQLRDHLQRVNMIPIEDDE
ncbi:hypothetical protein Scep_003811 [Stephania cephalantha]|uniref:Uncharacterized protein n=1 Tax=Stephania cephalantha TaxID=152367 RepID=A0AAP0PUR7_9MAGN